MSNLEAIHKILKALDKAIDFMGTKEAEEMLSPEALGINVQRLNALYAAMNDAGLTSGVRYIDKWNITTFDKCMITLKGFEYLERLETQQPKADAIVKDIRDNLDALTDEIASKLAGRLKTLKEVTANGRKDRRDEGQPAHHESG